MPEKNWWIIDVAGYGDFAFHGTETEAEDMRAHKSQWEGGAGKKRLATPDDPHRRDRMLIDREKADADA